MEKNQEQKNAPDFNSPGIRDGHSRERHRALVRPK